MATQEAMDFALRQLDTGEGEPDPEFERDLAALAQRGARRGGAGGVGISEGEVARIQALGEGREPTVVVEGAQINITEARDPEKVRVVVQEEMDKQSMMIADVLARARER